MTLRDAILPWRDYGTLQSTGLVRAANLGRDNLVRNTMDYLHLCDASELRSWKDLIEAFHEGSEVGLGVYKREPSNPDSNSIDNLVGSVYCSVKLGLTLHHDIFVHGRACNWTYCVAAPAFRFDPLAHPLLSWKYRGAWFWRNVAFPTMVKLQVGAEIDWVDRLTFKQACFFASLNQVDDVSNLILMLRICELCQGKDPGIDESIVWFKRRCTEKYPGGEREVNSYYYKIPVEMQPALGEVHPCVTFAPQSF